MKATKHLLILFILSVFLVLGTGCTVIRPHHQSRPGIHFKSKGRTPPGQMKKYYGKKSAKHFAPGQKKKHKR